ncbi:MAG: MerR family transcriptional regulator [Myxococcales bacterium]|nr:MerR family transcriptional regulator [Myxococcales bacterium]
MAQTTVRNVRSYQSKGLLPTPRREGRTNVYSDAHLARLRLISNLLGRGFTLSSIDEVLTAFERGEGFSELLGLEEAITSPWSTEPPGHVSLIELARMFGAAFSPAGVRRAIELDVLRRDGTRFIVPSMRLLNVGAELVRAGIPIEVLFEQIAELRGDVERISRRFVQLIAHEVFDRYGRDAIPPPGEQRRLTEFVNRVRPMAKTAVEVELARALEAVVQEELGQRLKRMFDAKVGEPPDEQG